MSETTKTIKGALYVIAVEIEDPPGADDETREGIMRMLKGALAGLTGSAASHGQAIKTFDTGCKIMRYSLTEKA